MCPAPCAPEPERNLRPAPPAPPSGRGHGHDTRITPRLGRYPGPPDPALSPLRRLRSPLQLNALTVTANARTEVTVVRALAPGHCRARSKSCTGRAAALLGHHRDCAGLAADSPA